MGGPPYRGFPADEEDNHYDLPEEEDVVVKQEADDATTPSTSATCP
jgi:hypothetical protein